MSEDDNREEDSTKTEVSQQKRRKKRTFLLYNIENDQVKRLRPACERCGPGFLMANHQDRYTCGHCGFTRYKTSENKKNL